MPPPPAKVTHDRQRNGTVLSVFRRHNIHIGIAQLIGWTDSADLGKNAHKRRLLQLLTCVCLITVTLQLAGTGFRVCSMSKVIRVADKFVNIRSSFKLGGIDIGTHTSLVKRKSGKWLMLDSVKLESQVKAEVDSITNNGADLEAVLNLHPFHTV